MDTSAWYTRKKSNNGLSIRTRTKVIRRKHIYVDSSLATNFNENAIKYKNIHLAILSAKCNTVCLGLIILKRIPSIHTVGSDKCHNCHRKTSAMANTVGTIECKWQYDETNYKKNIFFLLDINKIKILTITVMVEITILFPQSNCTAMFYVCLVENCVWHWNVYLAFWKKCISL